MEIILISSVLTMQVYSHSIENAESTMVDIFEAEVDYAEDKVTTCEISICIGTDTEDILIGSSLSETIYGLKGNDLFQGNDGEDIIYGGLGDDTIQGGSRLDKLFGQDGNDYLFADSSTSNVGALTENNKLLSIDDRSVDLHLSLITESVSVMNNTSLGDRSETTDVFSPLLPDILLSQQSYLDGGKGDDHLYGGSGDDTLLGGPGHDLFDCGEGSDQVLDFNSEEDTISTNCEMI